MHLVKWIITQENACHRNPASLDGCNSDPALSKMEGTVRRENKPDSS